MTAYEAPPQVTPGYDRKPNAREIISFINSGLSTMSQQVDGLQHKIEFVLKPQHAVAPEPDTPRPGDDAHLTEQLRYIQGTIESLRFKIRVLTDAVEI